MEGFDSLVYFRGRYLINVGDLVTVDMGSAFKDWLKIVYVIFAFCSAFSLGALKSIRFHFSFDSYDGLWSCFSYVMLLVYSF